LPLTGTLKPGLITHRERVPQDGARRSLTMRWSPSECVDRNGRSDLPVVCVLSPCDQLSRWQLAGEALGGVEDDVHGTIWRCHPRRRRRGRAALTAALVDGRAWANLAGPSPPTMRPPLSLDARHRRRNLLWPKAARTRRPPNRWRLAGCAPPSAGLRPVTSVSGSARSLPTHFAPVRGAGQGR
jgi:hypothetical protein